MTCKDCIHGKVCEQLCRGIDMCLMMRDENVELLCSDFKDKSLYVELPCCLGTQLYVIYANEIQKTSVFSMNIESECENWIYIIKAMVSMGGARFEKFVFGKNAFLTREEAEKALNK